MGKAALYSSSRRQPAASGSHAKAGSEAAAAVIAAPPPATTAAAAQPTHRLSGRRTVWVIVALLTVLLIALALDLGLALRPAQPPLTQRQIDAAVQKSLRTVPLPSPAAAAYATIAPSVVRVLAYGKLKRNKRLLERGVGAGVVIVNRGVILTSLHVVENADAVQVVFADGSESVADIINEEPENDMAVLQARTVPDDLPAATLRSTADLSVGDQVMAVGFPFGIGPSASAGVISGLNRVFQSPEGRQEMSNLIQFDAAANPGNSGGPLVTMDGSVVGIVTAILNPTPARTFIGIGFAVPIENASEAAGASPF
ncbi:MAG: peptidase S1 and S6, chymotrypsin/Hap [Burkholderiaceae bacterium]|jgi:S1-C subfamily serine protease|nr:MAG: peptidase S1 and S6, chymotrypsin/Hap [Burkholderiaceae bacterium]